MTHKYACKTACAQPTVDTHALHAVAASTRTTIRWSVVLGFRNPGARSDGRLITPEFEARRTPGLGPHDKAP